MQTKPESLFELLEPPVGGVERMHARFAERSEARRTFGITASGVAAVAALVALLAVLGMRIRDPIATDNAILAAPELDRLLGRETRAKPLEVERDGRALQTEEIPSSDPQVRIYRVL